MSTFLWPLQVFDSAAEYTVIVRRLPHWSQAGTICFLTWRTIDSIPKPVLRRWHADRESWLYRNGIDPKSSDWKAELAQLDRRSRWEYARTFSERWHQHLDSCHGACELSRPELRKIVRDSLLKFDSDRYEITDFVIMPNHVHLLAAFADEAMMLKQCNSWKHFQATKINRVLGVSGRFWQQDGFDHLVRTVEQFEALRRYIANNPNKAKLKPGSYSHYSKEPL